MNPVSPMIKIDFTCPKCTRSTRSTITVYEKIQRGGSTIYRPRQIPRPLTLMEKLRIARAKVHAEQAKKINNLFIKLLLLLLYYYKLKRYY